MTALQNARQFDQAGNEARCVTEIQKAVQLLISD